MSFGTNTAQSNLTGLAIAEETSYKQLPTTPIWTPLEPNEYSDFGGDVTTVERMPIKADRQRRKGVVTDLDASAGFGMDFTQKTPYNILPGFMFANWRQQAKAVINSNSATGLQTGVVNAPIGALLFVEGRTTPTNNGLFKKIGGSVSNILVDPAMEAEAGAAGTVVVVGFELGDGELSVEVSAGQAKLTRTSAAWASVGEIIPGQWLFVGGDLAEHGFATSNGWYRISSVDGLAITCDRFPESAVTEAGAAGKTIRVFFGDVLKNESDPSLIVCRSYTVERTLKADAHQYVIGAAANQLEISVPTSDKITAALTYIGADTVGETVRRTGIRPDLPQENAFNSVSNVTRLRMINDDTGSGLYTFVAEATLGIDNGVTPVKAIGTLGAFDLAVGDFVVSGSVSAYFTTIEAVQAVRENTSVSLDYSMITNNQGWLIDIPYLTMGDGRPNVEKDRPVTIPLTITGAAHPDFDHTMLINYFNYLPDLAG